MAELESKKQERFCQEYLLDYNGTQAAIRAGYKDKSARQQASRLLSNAAILARVRELQNEQSQRLAISQDYVMIQLVETYNQCKEATPVLEFNPATRSINTTAPVANGEPVAAVYERLGKDLEEFSVEMAANVEKKKNIVGENSVVISSYEKTAAVEPYYAEKNSTLFARLQAIIDDELVLDDLKTDVVTVHLWEEARAGAYTAIKEEAYIEITSNGGDTTGYQIPFTLHYTGVRTKGSFNISTKAFTPADAAGA